MNKDIHQACEEYRDAVCRGGSYPGIRDSFEAGARAQKRISDIEINKWKDKLETIKKLSVIMFATELGLTPTTERDE